MERKSLDARESSYPRREDIPVVNDGVVVSQADNPQSSSNPVGSSPPEIVGDVALDAPTQDVASLIAAPDSDELTDAPTQDVAAMTPEAPIHDPASTLEEVKNLIAPQSAEAELTGVVTIEPDLVSRRRRFMRAIHVPRARRVHAPVRIHTFDSFKHGSYVFLWLATAFSSAGFWLQQVIVGWLTYQVTESALWTSVALGLDALPILFVGPIGGLLVDKLDRRKLLAAIYAYQSVVTLIFAGVILSGNLQAWHIFAFIFFMGLSWVVSDPARMSLIPNIVPPESLVNAFALNSMAFSVTRLAAPALGGVLIAFAGVGPALLLEAALQLAAAGAAFSIRVSRADKPRVSLASARRDLAEGARYALEQPVLLSLFALTALPAVLIMPSVNGLMPVYAAEVFEVDARGLGLLVSAFGAGSTLGTLVLATKGDVGAKGKAALFGISATALATALFSVNTFFPTAYLNLMIVSAAMMVFFSISGAVVQRSVPDEFRGRVTGLYMIAWGLFPVGSLAAGYLAERLGVQQATQIMAGALILALALAIWKFRALRELR